VHCAALGMPVVGDPTYGRGEPPGTVLHLHARTVTVPLYPSRPPIAVAAPPPAHMLAALVQCGYAEVAALPAIGASPPPPP
jgi:hypothetical protein